VNAAQGIANQVQAALNSFVSNFQMAVKPQIIKSYASDENKYMNYLIFSSTKFSFYLLLIISLPILLEINQVLKIWLKTVPEFTPVFTVLIILIGLIICFSGPMKTAVQATGRIKRYQIVIGTLQLIILPISYIFSSWDIRLKQHCILQYLLNYFPYCLDCFSFVNLWIFL
jgi:Na+-driven multidrug efflux pump